MFDQLGYGRISRGSNELVDPTASTVLARGAVYLRTVKFA